MTNSTAVLLTAAKSCEKKVSWEMTLALSLIRLQHPKKSSNEPDSRHGFFSFVKKVGSAIVEDYTQTCERRNREIENAIFVLKGFLMTD